jgi:hypothetical protein
MYLLHGNAELLQYLLTQYGNNQNVVNVNIKLPMLFLINKKRSGKKKINQNEQEDKKEGWESERWIRTEAEIMNAQFR